MITNSYIKALFCAIFICISLSSIAQKDSAEYETYDLIILAKGGLIKGEILSFDEIGGGIVFKDKDGRTYSFAREEYDYFIEDKVYYVKKKKGPAELRERKENEWEFNIGFSASYLNLSHDFASDDYFINGVESLSDLPVCFKIGGGKYIDRNNYIGLMTEIAMLTQLSDFFNVGVRYLHQYDGYKSNVAFYIPVELHFNNMIVDSDFQVDDTTFSNNGLDYSYPTNLEIATSMKSVCLNVGHGFSFIMNNKKSVSVEIHLVKYFVITRKFPDLVGNKPNSKFNTTGAKFSLLFNL